MGTLVASFRFTVDGLSLTNTVECATSDHRITLSVVDPNGSELRLEVTLDAPNESSALLRARTVADAVYERMLLDLTPHITGSARPVQEAYRFSGLTGGAAVGLSVGTSAVIGTGVAVLDPALVRPSMERALHGVEAGQPVVSAMVYSARAMYRVAMQIDDPVASYLICYSALQLAALFKRGSDATEQRHVDDLLMAEDSAIHRVKVPRANGRASNETPFTTIRNRFVHAEGRDADPEGAARDMRDHLRTFRDLTARILRRL